MPTIRRLPTDVVNRIAAGEVIERPGSILKELVENSMDAGATEIFVELEEGGKKRVAVRDNGSGIEADELSLAFDSHATSKLREEDLEQNLLGVGTMGFRGEALASIAAVSRAEIISRVPGSEHGFRFRPGSGDEPEPAPREVGTTIEIAQLFFNTPARRKFLRATNTELSHSVQQFIRLALGAPGIHFRLTHGQKKLWDLMAVDTVRERLAQLHKPDVAAQLLEIKERRRAGAPSISGFVGPPEMHRRDTREQHFYVGGRWVRDRLLSQALRSAYEGCQIPGKHPVAYLFLDVPPSAVDVNVHPTKAEVRFRESSEIFGLVRSAVRNVLDGQRREQPYSSHSSRLESRFDLPSAGGRVGARRFDASGRNRMTSAEVSPRVDREGGGAGGGLGAVAGRPPGGRRLPAGELFPFIKSDEEAFGAAAPTRAPNDGPGPSDADPAGDGPAGEDELQRHPLGDAPPRRKTGSTRRGIQLLDSYILLDGPDGITLIDQHALHEKVLFEEVFESIRRSMVESQRLLIPEVVDLAPELMPWVETVRDRLAPLGFELEAFGERSVAVHGIPALFDREAGRTDVPAILQAAFDCIREGPEPEAKEGLTDSETAGVSETAVASGSPSGEASIEPPAAVHETLRRMAATVACKRAVKAGMRLTPEEIQSLLERGDLAEDPRFCPHGRPTTVLLSRREIERKFDRK